MREEHWPNMGRIVTFRKLKVCVSVYLAPSSCWVEALILVTYKPVPGRDIPLTSESSSVRGLSPRTTDSAVLTNSTISSSVVSRDSLQVGNTLAAALGYANTLLIFSPGHALQQLVVGADKVLQLRSARRLTQHFVTTAAHILAFAVSGVTAVVAATAAASVRMVVTATSFGRAAAVGGVRPITAGVGGQVVLVFVPRTVGMDRRPRAVLMHRIRG